MVGERKLKACKKAIMSLLAVGKEVTKAHLLDKSPKDNRGKQQNQKTIPITTVMQVKNHIASLPLKTSHYSSKKVYYLDAQLHI
ncbi:hypothetical protein ANN_19314 [Periplaneta americana]|uniref:Uncharacterized protein n=1 Tax=Periplaneta americana TaxID=6978 RepID=A0ABQ8S9I7_PERAM|nr:hypothetical protein ANN_19314 [Periplaneta americana]